MPMRLQAQAATIYRRNHPKPRKTCHAHEWPEGVCKPFANAVLYRMRPRLVVLGWERVCLCCATSHFPHWSAQGQDRRIIPRAPKLVSAPCLASKLRLPTLRGVSHETAKLEPRSLPSQERRGLFDEVNAMVRAPSGVAAPGLCFVDPLPESDGGLLLAGDCVEAELAAGGFGDGLLAEVWAGGGVLFGSPACAAISSRSMNKDSGRFG